jgi:hypothetical protein
MDDIGYIDDAKNPPKNKLRDIMKSYGFVIAIAFFIIYIVLQILFVNTFLSHIMIVNIPQTTYPPDVIQSWNNMADQLDQQMNKTYGPGNYTPFDRSYQHPQGPTQGTLTQLVPNVMPIMAIGLIVGAVLIWAGVSIAAFILLKLLGKSPGWSLVSAVGCAFLAFIPFLIISVVLLNMMPIYTIDNSAAISHSTTSLINNIKNDAQFQLVKPIMLVGWVCFGILCIFTIKVSEEVDLRQALIAGGIPIFLYILYDQSTYIMEFLHHFI